MRYVKVMFPILSCGIICILFDLYGFDFTAFYYFLGVLGGFIAGVISERIEE